MARSASASGVGASSYSLSKGLQFRVWGFRFRVLGVFDSHTRTMQARLHEVSLLQGVLGSRVVLLASYTSISQNLGVFRGCRFPVAAPSIQRLIERNPSFSSGLRRWRRLSWCSAGWKRTLVLRLLNVRSGFRGVGLWAAGFRLSHLEKQSAGI